MNKDKVIGGYNSTREGAKGARLNYFILLNHLGIYWISSYARFIGKPHGALLLRFKLLLEFFTFH